MAQRIDRGLQNDMIASKPWYLLESWLPTATQRSPNPVAISPDKAEVLRRQLHSSSDFSAVSLRLGAVLSVILVLFDSISAAQSAAPTTLISTPFATRDSQTGLPVFV